MSYIVNSGVLVVNNFYKPLHKPSKGSPSATDARTNTTAKSTLDAATKLDDSGTNKRKQTATDGSPTQTVGAPTNTDESPTKRTRLNAEDANKKLSAATAAAVVPSSAPNIRASTSITWNAASNTAANILLSSVPNPVASSSSSSVSNTAAVVVPSSIPDPLSSSAAWKASCLSSRSLNHIKKPKMSVSFEVESAEKERQSPLPLRTKVTVSSDQMEKMTKEDPQWRQKAPKSVHNSKKLQELEKGIARSPIVKKIKITPTQDQLGKVFATSFTNYLFLANNFKNDPDFQKMKAEALAKNINVDVEMQEIAKSFLALNSQYLGHLFHAVLTPLIENPTLSPPDRFVAFLQNFLDTLSEDLENLTVSGWPLFNANRLFILKDMVLPHLQKNENPFKSHAIENFFCANAYDFLYRIELEEVFTKVAKEFTQVDLMQSFDDALVEIEAEILGKKGNINWNELETHFADMAADCVDPEEEDLILAMYDIFANAEFKKAVQDYFSNVKEYMKRFARLM